MDKTGIIIIAICVAILGFWMVEQNKYAHDLQAWKLAHPEAQVQATNNIVGGSNTMSATASNGGSTATVPVFFNTSIPAQTLVLTNGRARYTFTSRGGGLDKVELLDFPDKLSARWRSHASPDSAYASLNTRAPAPMLSVLGDKDFVGDGNFTLTPLPDGVHAEKALPSGLLITKDFHLSSNYLVQTQIKLKNTSAMALNLMPEEIVAGTATPMDVDDIGMLWGAMWCDGTNAVDNPLPTFTGGGFLIWHRDPRTEIRAGNGNVVWVAPHNQFFAMVAMPKQPAQEMVARTIALPPFPETLTVTNGAPVPPAPQGVQTALVYPAQILQPDATVERDIDLYAGPKELRTLAVIGEQRQNHADLVMNWGSGYVAFWGIGTFFAKLLLTGMNTLHDLTTLGYGWVIVLITLLIRVLFWPLTARSTRSMKKMAALTPEMNALREKYKDDMQKLSSKQWELYRKHGVSPMSGCLPMMVQMPVFMGFFTMIRSAIELRGASFLWATDLSKPDTICFIPGLGIPVNPLPLMMVGAMLWQSFTTPTSPGMDPGQQKMMRWIPAVFILMFYNYSSGLALYMTVSTLMGIMQTKMTRASMATVSTTPAPAPVIDVKPKKSNKK